MRNSSSQQLELLCFEESESSADQMNVTRRAIKLRSQSPVVALGIIPKSTVRQPSAHLHDITVLQRNCTLTLLSGGTLDRVLEQNLVTLDETEEVIYAKVLPLESSKTGLRDRDDIVARLQLSATDVQHKLADHQLFLVVKTSAFTSKADVSLYSISNKHGTQLSQLETLSSWSLPESFWPIHRNKENRPKYSFDAKSGILQTVVGGVLHSVSLDSLQPLPLPTLQHAGTHLNDCIRISSSLVLAASKEHYGIYNTKYNCMLSVQSSAVVQASGSRKRKFQDDSSTAKPLTFVSWFSRLGQVIAISGSNLMSIQLSTKQGNFKRRKIDETPLIDVLGKGLRGDDLLSTVSEKSRIIKKQFPKPIGTPFEDSTYFQDQTTQWQYRVKELDELVKADRGQEFDQQIAHDLKISIKEDKQEDASAEDVSWNFTSNKAADNDALHRPKALYCLGRIFRAVEPSQGDTTESSESKKLEITFYPPNTFHWLILTGQLTPDLINEAFRSESNTSNTDTISGLDLVTAIVDFDSSFRLLYDILGEYPRLDLDILAHATKFILRSFDEAKLQRISTNHDNSVKTQKLLTNGDSLRIEEKSHVNGISQNESDDESELISDADAAFKELDHAFSILETGIEIRSECLRLAFNRLNSFAAPNITVAIRSTLSQHELVLLIHLLRIELADGGWHHRYVDTDLESFEPDEQYHHTLNIIVKMLSCAVDAIGVTGWLTSTTSNSIDAIDELLDSLRDEIGAVLEGLHEVTFLKGLLSEFMRYGWMREQAGQKPEVDHKDGAEITIKREDKKILPLGLKVEKRVSATKVKSGGEIRQRSKRDIGREISMAVGKYTFEEIRV